MDEQAFQIYVAMCANVRGDHPAKFDAIAASAYAAATAFGKRAQYEAEKACPPCEPESEGGETE